VVVALLAGLLAGCHSVCPKGATLKGSGPPGGTAQWCELEDTDPRSAVPTFGRSPAGGGVIADTTLGITRPAAHGRVIEGPSIEWHPHYTIASYGRYRAEGRASVPHGVFTFWHRDGRRHAQVTYDLGEPVGCAGMWDERGELRTGFVDGDRFRGAPCELEIDEEATEIALHNGFPTRRDLPQVEIDVGTLLAGGELPFASAEIPGASHEPGIRAAVTHPLVEVVAFGFTAHFMPTDGPHGAAGIAPLMTLAAPTPWSRAHLRASAETGIRLYTTRPRVDGLIAEQRTFVPTLYGALTLRLGVTLTRRLELQLGALLAHDVPRTVTRGNIHCVEDGYYCFNHVPTWRTGGTTAGALLQLRVRFY
jgi:hypothetical protein